MLADSTCREMSRNVEKRREMPRNVEKCREMSSFVEVADWGGPDKSHLQMLNIKVCAKKIGTLCKIS